LRPETFGLEQEVGMARVLVIEGGGVRGAFTAGAVGELAQHGAASFDEVYAVSAGGPTAAYLASDQVADGVDIWSTFIHGDQLLSWKNLPRGARLMNVDGLVEIFAEVVPLDLEALDRSSIRVHIGVTACETGAATHVRMTSKNALELLRATMALPVAYGRTVDVEGVRYIDGGVAMPIPLAPALARPGDEIVLVLTRPRGYRRRRDPATSRLIGLTYPQHPQVRRALVERNAHANDVLAQIEQLEDAGRITVVRPREALPVGRLGRDRESIRATLEEGRAAARTWLQHQGWPSTSRRSA
jgi:predicted patatin/cPLA2 family phospholipase